MISISPHSFFVIRSLSELENGVVNVRIEVKRCGSGGTLRNVFLYCVSFRICAFVYVACFLVIFIIYHFYLSNIFFSPPSFSITPWHTSISSTYAQYPSELITKGLSGWLAEEQSSSSSSQTSTNIHSRAGYYKIDIGNKNDDNGCIVNDEGIKILNGVDDSGGGSVSTINGDSSTNNGGGGGQNLGCYLVISSPKDYEITTTFPLPYPYGFYGRGGGVRSTDVGSIEEDIFHWIRCEFPLLIYVILYMIDLWWREFFGFCTSELDLTPCYSIYLLIQTKIWDHSPKIPFEEMT